MNSAFKRLSLFINRDKQSKKMTYSLRIRTSEKSLSGTGAAMPFAATCSSGQE